MDYEQLYYDSQYEIKKLKEKIEILENELTLVSKHLKGKLDIHKEIINELNSYFEKRGNHEFNKRGNDIGNGRINQAKKCCRRTTK